MKSIFSLACALVVGAVSTTNAADQPNILFIMSDDHAAHAIGAYGGRLAVLNPTPTLDRLAHEGVLMKNAFCVNAICTPSRANIMTGLHSHRNGVTTLNGVVKPADQTLAIEMKRAGYETAVIGKWHLQEEPAAFDFYTVLPGQGSYFNPVFLVRGPQPWPRNEIRTGGYDSKHSSDAITDISLKWLRERKDKSKPFFLMHHFKAPHDNFENAERYDWLYEDINIPEPESLWRRGNHGPVGRPQYGTSIGKRNERRNMGHHMFVDPALGDAEYKREAYQRYLKKFLRCVRGIDDNILRLIEHLEKTGELDNTVIIYTADQGFNLGEHDYIDKRWMYEETLRMPFIVRYPKRFKAGTVIEDIVNNVDFTPTLLELAGIPAADMPRQFQGRSFVANMEGRTPGDWPGQTYYRYWMHMAHHDNPAHYGLRTREHKLIFFYGLPLDAPGAQNEPTEPWLELYDLTRDPHEMNNVINDPHYATVLAELKAKLLAEKEKIGDTDDKYPDLVKVRQATW
ncbi:MAG TPA: acetylglucosamine-6-sulfatase [Verrucomicrobiales bacterium]|nr:acetylglucosamine-6-sulfatase [Verrucomicrobiales bacterium]